MEISIRNRWTNEIIFSHDQEFNTMAIVVSIYLRSSADLRSADLSGANLRSADLRSANLSGADLRSADLSGAYLSGANLSGAYLSGANLRSADLSGANLRSADLSGANLRSADLRSANLSGAYLSGADLRSANLSGAYLSGADLRSADLSGAYLRSANLRSANLSGADLSVIKSDFFMILLYAINEVHALRVAIIDGKIDGSTYTGSCACLVGTLANERHCQYNQLNGITPDAARPAERLFAAIKPGDNPENSAVSLIVLGWIDEFIACLGYVRK